MLYTQKSLTNSNISYQFKFISTKFGLSSQKIRLDGVTKDHLPDDAKVIGQIKHFYSNEPKGNCIDLGHNIYAKIRLRKPVFPAAMYIKTNTDEYLAIRNSILPWLLLIIAIIVAAVLALLFKPASNANVISISDITDSENIPIQTMAYISGESNQEVSANQPYIYLKNDEKNKDLNYVFKYTVFVDDKEIHQSGDIKPGKAEPLDIYHDDSISNGVHDLSYKIDVYMSDDLVASTNVNGLNVTKLQSHN